MIDEPIKNIGWDKRDFVVITDGEDTWCQFTGDQAGSGVNDDTGHDEMHISIRKEKDMLREELLILADTFEMFSCLLRYAKKELHDCKTIGDFRKTEIAQMCDGFTFDGLETKDADPGNPWDVYVELEEIPYTCDAYEWQIVTVDPCFGLSSLCRICYDKKTNTFENEKGADWQNDLNDFCDGYGMDSTDPDIQETIKRGMALLPVDGNDNGSRIDLSGIDIDEDYSLKIEPLGTREEWLADIK